MSDVEYWDREARDDQRYAAANWGMDADDDAPATIKSILTFIETTLPHERARVLEIGCGPCRLLLPLAERHPDGEFYGIDISPEMLAIAKRRITAASTHNITVALNGGHLARASFDVVYCVELLQHLDDDWARAVISAAHAMLRRHGKLVAQYVSEGEPGPHSFPRPSIGLLYVDPWDAVSIRRGFVHPAWDWAVTSKR